MIGEHAGAIFWAQWRSLLNHTFRRGGASSIVTGFFLLIWYGMWTFGAWGLADLAANPDSFREIVAPALPGGLLIASVYWQAVPIVMASSGISLDLSRLIVYPIPHGQLFLIEALLRISTAVEMMLVMAGLAGGLLLNPQLPWWAALAVLPFTLTNVLLSAGLRDLFARLTARRGIREILVLGMVLTFAAPQVLVLTIPGRSWLNLMQGGAGAYWPWSAAAAVAQGEAIPADVAATFFWTVLAGWFARRQFERSLRFDAAASRAAGRSNRTRASLLDLLLAIPDRWLPDSVATLLSKEIRFLSRAPRFRLLFLMGFTFGLLIWLPMTIQASEQSLLRSNYLTIVSAYALLLLGEVLFWNNLGMDRSAVQTYFVAPVRLSTVLIAKNLAAAFFVLLNSAIVAVFCFLLRMPVTIHDVGEAFATTAVLAFFMMSAGNILSVKYPRAVDPAQSWRNSGGRSQVYLLLLYPLASIPILLAWGARYAFDSDLAFWGVILLDFFLAGVVYSIALESASNSAWNRREYIVSELSKSTSPVSG